MITAGANAKAQEAHCQPFEGFPEHICNATSFSSKMHAGDPEDNSSEILCLYCNNEHD
jgi:hypothetical protein